MHCWSFCKEKKDKRERERERAENNIDVCNIELKTNIHLSHICQVVQPKQVNSKLLLCLRFYIFIVLSDLQDVTPDPLHHHRTSIKGSNISHCAFELSIVLPKLVF